MADVVSIEVTLDATLEKAVRAEWEALASAGLSSMAAHTAPSNRPHITVLARPTLGTFDATGLSSPFPMPLTLGAPILFGSGDRRVLARSVVLDARLLALHTAVHERAGVGPDLPHTTAGDWTPHVTLARRVRLDDVPAALRLLGGDLSGHGTELRRWDSADRRITPLAGTDSEENA